MILLFKRQSVTLPPWKRILVEYLFQVNPHSVPFIKVCAVQFTWGVSFAVSAKRGGEGMQSQVIRHQSSRVDTDVPPVMLFGMEGIVEG